jgi:hypothetical protein
MSILGQLKLKFAFLITNLYSPKVYFITVKKRIRLKIIKLDKKRIIQYNVNRWKLRLIWK